MQFPLWLAPEQVKLIPISEEQIDYAQKIAEELKRCGMRVAVDSRNEKMQRKIRDAQVAKIPYMAIVGKIEKENNTVSLRNRKDGDKGVIDRKELISLFTEEIARKGG